jgi:hypothetical protein
MMPPFDIALLQHPAARHTLPDPRNLASLPEKPAPKPLLNLLAGLLLHRPQQV